MPRILAIDDDETTLSTIRNLLLHAGHEVEVAADGETGLSMAAQEHFDLIILDVVLPGIDGLEVCRTLRSGSNVPILMLSALGEVESRVDGLLVGADDYLPKPFNSQELLARVAAVLRRVAWVPSGAGPEPPKSMRVGDLEIDLVYRRASHFGEPLRLSPKEFDLLVFLASHAGQFCSADELLTEVWRFDNPSDIRTIPVHVWSLRQKLERDPSRPRLIQTSRGKGYRLAVS